jgi:hypothetical protein
MAAKVETARNTRAVASQRSMRRTSPGSVGGWEPLKKLCLDVTRKIHFRGERICGDARNVTHIIDKKERLARKTFLNDTLAYPIPLSKRLTNLACAVTSVTSRRYHSAPKILTRVVFCATIINFGRQPP